MDHVSWTDRSYCLTLALFVLSLRDKQTLHDIAAASQCEAVAESL